MATEKALPTVKLTTETGHSWTTSVSSITTEQTAKAYFLNQEFDVSPDPETEDMQTVVQVEFTPGSN